MGKTVTIPIRVTPAEKLLIEERAQTRGLKTSEYLRRLAIDGSTRPQPKVTPPTDELERRVRETALRMPRRAAENVVKREMDRERSQ